MINDFLAKFGNSRLKSMEIPVRTLEEIGNDCNSPRGFTDFPLCHFHVKNVI